MIVKIIERLGLTSAPVPGTLAHSMNYAEAAKMCPHLISPATLALADTNGKWKLAKHLEAATRALVEAWYTPNSRTALIIPFQHGKSILGSVYYPAWVLLRWPETRIALASYEEGFAASFGARVRDIITRFGEVSGVRLRTDTNSKGEWVIDEFGGGMICKGRGGALNGRPADLLILDDLIKNPEEAQSQTILDGIWDWYCTVAYSRLGPKAPIVIIGTRWCKNDLHGRIEQEEKVGGEKFKRIVFKAIAEENDVLGRQPGEALWPQRVPLDRLKNIQQRRPRWFRACWQGDPEENEGLHFQPETWRRYTDVGDAWRIWDGFQWLHYRKVDCAVLIAVDWAAAGKKDSDFTAFVAAALTYDGKLLILRVFNQRLRYEQNGPALDRWCRELRYVGCDLLVSGEDDVLSEAMVVECRRYRCIPELRSLKIKAKNKLIRAQAAIIRSQNGLFFYPDPPQDWEAMTSEQLSEFTGMGGVDDIADCFGVLGRLANEFYPDEDQEDFETVSTAGYFPQWSLVS